MANSTYFVKFRNRKPSRSPFYFLTPTGGSNRLRIHAAQFYDKQKADATAKQINDEFPEYEAKVVNA
jgi:hypothetical protein